MNYTRTVNVSLHQYSLEVCFDIGQMVIYVDWCALGFCSFELQLDRVYEFIVCDCRDVIRLTTLYLIWMTVINVGSVSVCRT